jgi:hypothetical protein
MTSIECNGTVSTSTLARSSTRSVSITCAYHSALHPLSAASSGGESWRVGHDRTDGRVIGTMIQVRGIADASIVGA